MPREARSKLSPWIEQLILDYGGEERSGGTGRLRAHVVGVGHISASQARSCESPAGLLFLSDGELRIPAVLTASAWENVQEQEDREYLSSLVNTTVCIRDVRLQFHMAPEQTRCGFFLSVGDLATTAAGPVKGAAACCTTLPSVRLKTAETWRALLTAEDSQQSQRVGFDLSELLGEWQHERLQAVLQDVGERAAAANSPRPSMSAPAPGAVAATGWDVDRVRDKGVKRFTVPMKCLLVSGADAGGRAAPHLSRAPDVTQPLVVGAEMHRGLAAAAERGWDAVVNSPPHPHLLAEMADVHIRPLDNPWDMFPPPCDTSSSSDSSPEARPPPHSLHKLAPVTPTRDNAATLTSTQLPVCSSKESQQAPEHSFLPLYQNPLDSTSRCTSAAPSGERSGCAAQQHLPAVEQESQMSAKVAEMFERTHRKAKRKRSESTPEVLSTSMQEDGRVSRSPPSWLFDSQAGCRPDEHQGHRRGQKAGATFRKTPAVHSNGSSFSYSYKVSGDNLQDFSRFKVDEDLLRWAVKILVPEPTDDPHNTSGNSARSNDAEL